MVRPGAPWPLRQSLSRAITTSSLALALCLNRCVSQEPRGRPRRCCGVAHVVLLSSTPALCLPAFLAILPSLRPLQTPIAPRHSNQIVSPSSDAQCLAAPLERATQRPCLNLTQLSNPPPDLNSPNPPPDLALLGSQRILLSPSLTPKPLPVTYFLRRHRLTLPLLIYHPYHRPPSSHAALELV